MNDEARGPFSFAGAFGPSAPPLCLNPLNREHVDATYRMPKLSSFFREDPALWFAQAELAFECSHVRSERARAGAVVSSLDCDVLQSIGDLITSAVPIPDLYTRIK